MWVKKDQSELSASLGKERRRSIMLALASWVGLSALLIALPLIELLTARVPFTTYDVAILKRATLTTLASGIAVLILFAAFRSRRQLLVCPNCDAVKPADGNPHCFCGTEMADIRLMKWVDRHRQY